MPYTIGSKYMVWSKKADRTPGGKTKKDIVRIAIPGGGYRYVFKSRRAHGQKMYKKNQATMKRYQYRKSRA